MWEELFERVIAAEKQREWVGGTLIKDWNGIGTEVVVVTRAIYLKALRDLRDAIDSKIDEMES